MEVVLLVVAVIGVALLVVPRVKRNRKPGARRSVPSVKARRRAAVAAAAAPASTWSPSGGGSEEDGWDDDLGWEGVDRPAPETREAWERWRETESPLAAAPAPAEPSTELPSVERWRAAAASPPDEAEWLDDDGLGWEGEESRSDSRVWVGEPAAHAVAAPEVTTQVEPAEPAGHEWATSPVTNGNGHATPVSAPAQRRFGLHPVLMVALYAAVGIGVVVLASTLLFGGSSAPEPASNPAPPKTSPKSTAPQVTGSLADEEFDVSVEPEDSATTAARNARRAFERERARGLAAERKAREAKAAEARQKAAAERRKREQQRQPRGGGGNPPTTPQSGSGGGGGAPQGGSPAPAPAPRCEFCIG